MANKFLPHNVQVNETKFYNRHAISMLPTMPVPVETIQSAEITSPTSAQNSSNNSSVVVGSNPCAVPIATLSIRDLRLRGSSFIRSHASKHGLPNASRKLMKEVIELLKSHYAVVHQVTMSMEVDKTFQTEANTPLITKMALKIFLNIFSRSY